MRGQASLLAIVPRWMRCDACRLSGDAGQQPRTAGLLSGAAGLLSGAAGLLSGIACLHRSVADHPHSNAGLLRRETAIHAAMQTGFAAFPSSYARKQCSIASKLTCVAALQGSNAEKQTCSCPRMWMWHPGWHASRQGRSAMIESWLASQRCRPATQRRWRAAQRFIAAIRDLEAPARPVRMPA